VRKAEPLITPPRRESYIFKDKVLDLGKGRRVIWFCEKAESLLDFVLIFLISVFTNIDKNKNNDRYN
jgi:hypothetical protein